MKRILPILLALVLCLGACRQAAPPAVQPEPEPSSAAPAPEEPAPPAPEEPPIPADAALYRGVITALESDPDGLLLTLEQAPGTDFGAEALRARLTGDTWVSTEADALAVGDYLEVHYGAWGEMPEETDVITAILLPDADLCLYNGAVQSITGDEAGEGILALEALEGDGEIHFRYSQDTQFYLDVDALAPGDKVNVYFNGITTRSLPPQATALEVRPWAEPPAQSPAESSAPSQPQAQTDQGTVEVVAQPASYPASAESVTVQLTNHSGEELWLGLHYQIQRKTETGWETLPLDFVVIEIALQAPVGESITQPFSLHRDQYDYTPGSYRLLWQNQEELAAPFTLT